MTDYIAESKPAIIDLDKRMFVRIIVSGLLIGLATWGFGYLLDRFILSAWFCNDTATQACSSSLIYAGNISAVVMAVVGISALVKLGVFRPLLIVLASLITLWGLSGWLASLSIVEAAVWSSLVYGLSYITYAWLARIRRAAVMMIVVVLVVVSARLVAAFL
jgi:hypothetical protein